MSFFKKLFGGSRTKKTSGRRRSKRFPEKVLAPVEEIIEQGMLVDNVAIRMSVKNSIIMNALKRNVDYRVEEIHDLVREQVLALADERENDAKHIARVRDEIQRYGRSAWQETEYSNQDSKTLKHRQQVYEGLGSQLRDLATDQPFITRTAEQAREAAWSEIGNSLKERATHPYYSGGASAEYQAARDDRIQSFIDEDLTTLIRTQMTQEPAAQLAEEPSGAGFFKRKRASSARKD